MWHRQHAGLGAATCLLFGVLVLLPATTAGASAQVCMGVVVDDGNGVTPVPQAANVAPGTSDLQALSAVGDTPTQSNSGLVCAIGGYPANGLADCNSTSGTLYYFWSYWEGDPYTNTWTYAQIGPASHDVAAGQTYVEGWRYEDPGPANASATKPAVTPAAAFAQACPGITPVASSGGGSGGSGGGGTSGGGTSTPVTTPPDPTTAPPASGAKGSTPASGPAGVGSGTHASTTTTTTTTTTASATGAGAADHATTTSVAGKGQSGRTAAKNALADAASHQRAGGDPVLPIIVVVVLVALLGGLAWFRWRRRPAEE